jgi:16S rRNA G966 N2-methylase RsmD
MNNKNSKNSKMLKENYTNEEKIEIAKQIKNITFEEIKEEMKQLIQIGSNACNMSPRSRIGNNLVDYFTFSQRLSTKGKYNINFYEFIVNLDQFKKKKFIQNMLQYYDTVKNKTKKKNYYTVLKEVYNICISAINIIRPLVYMEIYAKYNPKCILDFCAGWGGAAVAASALNIPRYIGIELNHSLIQPYNHLIEFLKERSKTDVQMIFDSALNVDYSKLDYDFVFTSPPYYFIQKYENNAEYVSKKEMDELFYFPLFSNTYANLKPNGVYALNINKEVYENVCIKLFGPAHDSYPYKKSKRQNYYDEIVYVWKK